MAGQLEDLNAFLRRLESSRLHYTLGHHRDDAIMVTVAVPGELWEIEFLDSGDIEVEVFRSNGQIGGPERLAALFEQERT